MNLSIRFMGFGTIQVQAVPEVVERAICEDGGVLETVP